MKREYETPTCELIKITLKDVIMTSEAEGAGGGGDGGGSGGFGENEDDFGF